MAKTILEAFNALRTNLEITGLQESTVSTRQQEVRNALDNGLEVLDTFLTGSYRRSTMIAPLAKADVDIFAVLSPGYFSQQNPASLLDVTRSVLLRRYPTTPRINRSGHAVTISFTDFRVDVVPAFHRTGGGYIIPDSNTGAWISTNPTIHTELIATANKTHGGSLVPLVKMLKGWNRQAGYPFRSFYLELLAEEVLRGITISSFPSGVRFVLAKGCERVRQKIVDPAGYGDWINPLDKNQDVETAVATFTTATSRALAAEQLAAHGSVRDAITVWRQLFGECFPAYG